MTKFKAILIAISATALSLIGVFLSGRKAGKDEVNKDNAIYQKESIERAYKAMNVTKKEGEEVKEDAIEKANNDDFSGFNNKL